MRDRLQAIHPSAYFLDQADTKGLTAWLRHRELLDDDEVVSRLAPAGDAIMNLTLRAELRERSLIVKQARPWIEARPEERGPIDRALVEVRFYELIAHHPEISARMPRLLGSNAESRLLVLQDLGEASDFSDLYRADFVYGEGEVEDLLDWLGRLHRLEVPDEALLVNGGMRELTHHQVFVEPMDPGNGLDYNAIRPGLGRLAEAMQQDGAFWRALRALGLRYMAPGRTLVHGDFFPGSFLRTDAGVRVIDPEFAHLGMAEWDVGVFLAHFLLTCHDADTIPQVLDAYPAGPDFDPAVAKGFAGAELVRRIIGPAQLPIETELGHLASLLDLAREWVRTTQLN